MINAENFSSCSLPLEARGLGAAGGGELAAAIGIEQNLAQAPRDIENVVGADQQGGGPHRFDQRGDIGGNHGRSTGHRFEGGEAEPFIQGWKCEYGGGAIEYAERFGGNEA